MPGYCPILEFDRFGREYPQYARTIRHLPDSLVQEFCCGLGCSVICPEEMADKLGHKHVEDRQVSLFGEEETE
jgi:hypothetical protein